MAQSLQIQRISKAWHERLVDLEIERPDLSLGQIAQLLGVTPTHLSVVRNSDAFLEYRALRMKEHQDRVSSAVIARTQKTALKGLEILHDRMEAEKATIGLEMAKNITEMTLKSLGYGARAPVGVSVQVNNSPQYHLNSGEREAFESARNKLKLVNQQNTERLNTENTEVEEAVELPELPELPPDLEELYLELPDPGQIGSEFNAPDLDLDQFADASDIPEPDQTNTQTQDDPRGEEQ